MTEQRGRKTYRWFPFVGLCVVFGCNPEPVAPTLLEADPVWSLGIPTKTIIMSNIAPYDTLRMIVAPRRLSGASATNAGPLTFSVNTQALDIDTQGLVKAYQTTERAQVVVTLLDTITGRKISEAVSIIVTDVPNPPKLTTFTFAPAPGDSTSLAFLSNVGLLPTAGYKTLWVTAQDTGVTNFASQLKLTYAFANGRRKSSCLAFTDSSSTQATFVGLRPRCVDTVVARTMFYGVTRQDSVVLSVGYPLESKIGLVFGERSSNDEFPPDSITIAMGGIVLFSAGLSSRPLTPEMSYRIVFEDPTSVMSSPLGDGVSLYTASGDVATLDAYWNGTTPEEAVGALLTCLEGRHRCFELRAFPKAGIYRYRLLPINRSGVIAVVPNTH